MAIILQIKNLGSLGGRSAEKRPMIENSHSIQKQICQINTLLSGKRDGQ
jgi:hypothetical protein